MFFVKALVVALTMHKLIETPLYMFNYLVCVHTLLIKHVILVPVVVDVVDAAIAVFHC